jgi:indolepyruvate ferredoxin oxidoreductase alpha subunit
MDRRFNRILNAEAGSELAVVATGNCFSVLMDLLAEHGLEEGLPVLKVGTPFPFPRNLIQDFVGRYPHVLVLEETDQVIELLLRERSRVMGRHDGTVPDEGELDAGVIGRLLSELLVRHGLIEEPWELGEEAASLSAGVDLPSRPPTLCVGCPHRGSFFAIRRAGGKHGIYPSDIGCYTLGVNMEAVDTCHDMGAAVSMAAGFYHAYAHDEKNGGEPAPGKESRVPKIIATIGDSTFYHGGLSPLASAVSTGARFTLVILDNMVTAMTGMQPTLLSGLQPDGRVGHPLSVEETCQGLGVRWLRVTDPFDVPGMIETLKEALAFNRDPEGGPAVVISRRPCVIHQRDSFEPRPVEVNERCNRCDICIDYFGCPALQVGDDTVVIDHAICADCGVCVHTCARGAILPEGTVVEEMTEPPEGEKEPEA